MDYSTKITLIDSGIYLCKGHDAVRGYNDVSLCYI